MELHPGVFVSNVATQEWEKDPEVGEVHMICNAEGVQCGLALVKETPEKPIRFISKERETVIILEGSVHIEIAGGPTLDLKKGDVASLPRGADTLCTVTAPFKEMWVKA